LISFYPNLNGIVVGNWLENRAAEVVVALATSVNVTESCGDLAGRQRAIIESVKVRVSS
jgi:hypothetical protein